MKADEVRNEIRNHLAVAIAHIEGFRDEVLTATPERLDGVLAALAEAELLVTAFSSVRDIDLRTAEVAHAVFSVALSQAQLPLELTLACRPGDGLELRLHAPAQCPTGEQLEMELGVLHRIAETHGAEVEYQQGADGTCLRFRLGGVKG